MPWAARVGATPALIRSAASLAGSMATQSVARRAWPRGELFGRHPEAGRRRANWPSKCGPKRNWKLALATQTPIPFAITLTLFAQFIPVDTSESKFSTFVAANLSIGPIRIYLDASRTKLESL